MILFFDQIDTFYTIFYSVYFEHLYILFSLYMIRQIIKKSTIGRFLYGNLKDSDRIFTNVYKDGDPYIKGALLRVI